MAEALTSLLFSVMAASGVHAAAGLDSEVAVGAAPAVIGQEPEPVQAFRLAPLLGVKAGGGDHSLSLSYAPRFFWRRPDLGTVQLPVQLGDEPPTNGESEIRRDALLLHRAQLLHIVQVTPRLRVQSNVNASVGEVNYNAAQDILAANRGQSRVVRTLVVDLYRYEGQANFEYTASAQDRWTANFAFEATGPRGREEASIGDVLQRSDSTGVTVAWARRLTRRDQITLSAQTAFQRLEATGNYFLAQPELGYTRNFSSQTNATATLGAVFLSRLALPKPSGLVDEFAIGASEPPGVNATGSLRLQSELYRKRGVKVAFDGGGGLDWFLDPIVGKFFPTLAVDAGLDIDLGRSWELNPFASLFSVLDSQPSEQRAALLRGGGPPGLYDPADPVDSTRLGFELPIRYRVVPGTYLTAGSRASLRTRRFASPLFRWTEQVEYWAYLGLTVQWTDERYADDDWLYKPPDTATRAQDN